LTGTFHQNPHAKGVRSVAKNGKGMKRLQSSEASKIGSEMGKNLF